MPQGISIKSNQWEKDLYVCELTEEDIKNRNNTFDVECVNFIKSVLI